MPSSLPESRWHLAQLLTHAHSKLSAFVLFTWTRTTLSALIKNLTHIRFSWVVWTPKGWIQFCHYIFFLCFHPLRSNHQVTFFHEVCLQNHPKALCKRTYPIWLSQVCMFWLSEESWWGKRQNSLMLVPPLWQMMCWHSSCVAALPLVQQRQTDKAQASGVSF